jgi:phosphodiesterase/alkaline phosphatase D-like protein
MRPTRRELLQLLGASGLALATGCAGAGDEPAATAVLDPGEDAVTIAVWSAAAAEVRIRILADGADRALVGEATLALDGGIGALEITGLTAATAYEIAITIGGTAPRIHRVRTAPGADDPRPVRLAVVADYDPSPAFATGIVDELIAAGPELVISLGDFPYTDNGPPAQTVTEYRERHIATRSHPPVRALLASCGLAAIYDDHEVVNDWDAASAAAQPARHAAALQVWDEFFPRRAAAGEVRYRRWRWGAHLECFLLDCRRFRSANAAPDDAAKTMLGAAQRDWLIDGVTGSTATFKLVLTGVPLDFGRGDDHWASFATERDAIFAALVGVPGVLFVSGDQHWFAAHRHAFGIRELQIGPIARGIGQPLGEPPGVLFRATRYNVGVVDVDGDRLSFVALGDDGTALYRETLTASELTPTA